MAACQALLMQWAKRWFWASLLSVCWVGCAGAQKSVQNVAEHDLACDKVEVSKLGDDRFAAAGCGRGAVYKESCDDGGCRWGRMRHGHEDELARENQPPMLAPGPREVLPAPAPAQREVTPAPPPQQREVIPAPPPGAANDTQNPAASSGGEAPASDAALASQVTPLSEGQLSDPYEATVPAEPTTQQVAYPPPAPLYETRPPAPYVTYVWVPGYWWWATAGWTWLPGYWCAPRPGFAFVAGGWYWGAGWWWYSPGGWAYPGTTTVVYAPPPRPNRVVTVRTFHPQRTVRPAPAPGRVAGVRGLAPAARSPALRPSTSAASPTVRPGSAYRPTGSPLVRYPVSPSMARQQRAYMTPRAGYAPASKGYVPPSKWAQAQSQGSVGRVVQPNAPRPSYSSAFSSSPARISPDSSKQSGFNKSSGMPRGSSAIPSSPHVRPSAPSSGAYMNNRSFSHGSSPSRNLSPSVVRPRR